MNLQFNSADKAHILKWHAASISDKMKTCMSSYSIAICTAQEITNVD